MMQSPSGVYWNADSHPHQRRLWEPGVSQELPGDADTTGPWTSLSSKPPSGTTSLTVGLPLGSLSLRDFNHTSLSGKACVTNVSLMSHICHKAHKQVVNHREDEKQVEWAPFFDDCWKSVLSRADTSRQESPLEVRLLVSTVEGCVCFKLSFG